VKRAVGEATATVNSSVSISQEMYLEALTDGINMAEARKRGKGGSKYVTGGL
jgi:hypothetical protein